MKERLDILLVNMGLAPTRSRAAAMIKAQSVCVNGKRAVKPGAVFDDELCTITVADDALKYVSRGGLKLEGAIKEFGLDISGKICLDIGSSTGGFTDCMLQNGAAKVIAVDVGSDQLDAKLRGDDRVVVMEQTNFRYLTAEDIGGTVSFATCDVSFISLDKILPNAYELLQEGARMVCLIKPQFEVGKENLGKGGIVKNSKDIEKVITRVTDNAREIGFEVLGVTDSPIKGGDGNREYLMLIRKN